MRCADANCAAIEKDKKGGKCWNAKDCLESRLKSLLKRKWIKHTDVQSTIRFEAIKSRKKKTNHNDNWVQREKKDDRKIHAYKKIGLIHYTIAHEEYQNLSPLKKREKMVYVSFVIAIETPA